MAGLKASPFVQQQRQVSVAIGSCAALTTTTISLTVPGVDTGDVAVVSCPTLDTGLFIADAYCSTAGTLTVKLANATSAAIDPAGGDTFNVIVL